MTNNRSNSGNYQSINIGDIDAGGNVNISQVNQSGNIALSPAVQDFVFQLQSVSSDLAKIQRQHSDIQEAVTTLQDVIGDVERGNTNPSRIRSAFFAAKGFLESAATVVSTSAVIVKAISEIDTLLPKIKNLFS